MFDLAGLLARQPPPSGDRVAVVTNAGGLGVQCADACAAAGLRVAPLGEPAQRALEAALPPGAAVSNPVDLSAGAGAADYERALACVLPDPGVDAVIVLFARSLATPAERRGRRRRRRRRAPAAGPRACSWARTRRRSRPTRRARRASRRPRRPSGRCGARSSTRAGWRDRPTISGRSRASTPIARRRSSRPAWPRAAAGCRPRRSRRCCTATASALPRAAWRPRRAARSGRPRGSAGRSP